MKKVFTTGQVAKICKLLLRPRTVSKWFDSGRLRGYRIPGSQDRRIPREHLIKFLKEHGMPLGDLEEEGLHKVLIIGAERLFIDRVKELLPEDEDFKFELAHSGFEAGIQAESFHPDSIIFDLGLGRSEALQIATNLRKNPAYEATMIIAMASEDEANPEGLVNYGFNETFKKPFDVACLRNGSARSSKRSGPTCKGRFQLAGTGEILGVRRPLFLAEGQAQRRGSPRTCLALRASRWMGLRPVPRVQTTRPIASPRRETGLRILLVADDLATTFASRSEGRPVRDPSYGKRPDRSRPRV